MPKGIRSRIPLATWEGGIDWMARVFTALSSQRAGLVPSSRTRRTVSSVVDKVVSTDPPYYDNIGYADLSDFFYVWLRRSLKTVFPDLFATLAVPKAEELVATPYRHGGKGEGGGFLPRWHDTGDAPLGRAGAPGIPSHHLLRLQAVRERWRRQAPQAPAGRPSSTQ